MTVNSLHQVPYDYTVEVRNRFKGLDLIDRVPEELWMEVCDIVQDAGIKTIPKKKKCRKTIWLSVEALLIAEKRRVVFAGLEQNISKFLWKHKKPQIAIEILRKKNGAGGIKLPDFRLYYKATVIKAVWYSQKQTYRPMKQGRSQEINPHIYGHLIFDKGGKNIQRR